MAIRQELVNSAVIFLRDPSVADASLEKRVEFLQSKDLTREEIDEALRRAESAPPLPSSPPPSSNTGAVGATMGPAAYPYTYNPPPLPERDWKDYFVMATVSVGVTYGLYQVAKRYVLPMILPPTPESLEADKAALEAEFAKTEALVEQLASDTEALKASEQKRAETFDQVIKDARSAIGAVQSQADERKQDLRLLKAHVETLQELIPKSLARHKESQDTALKELQDELKSLKQLISNRTRVSGVPPASSVPSSVTLPKKPNSDFVPQVVGSTPPVVPVQASVPSQIPGQAPPQAPSQVPAGVAPTPGQPLSSSEPKAAPTIPAWQRQAAGK